MRQTVVDDLADRAGRSMAEGLDFLIQRMGQDELALPAQLTPATHLITLKVSL
jgi:hypothetical protein